MKLYPRKAFPLLLDTCQKLEPSPKLTPLLGEKSTTATVVKDLVNKVKNSQEGEDLDLPLIWVAVQLYPYSAEKDKKSTLDVKALAGFFAAKFEKEGDKWEALFGTSLGVFGIFLKFQKVEEIEAELSFLMEASKKFPGSLLVLKTVAGFLETYFRYNSSPFF